MQNCIRQARQARGFTQERLADELGVSTGTISQWESGTREPRAVMLCHIADTLDVSTDQLLGRKPLIAES